MTKDLSSDFFEFYSSREDFDRKGIGYPSCNRGLSKVARKRNMNDTNGYYEFLNLPPWAELAHIKTRLRQYFRKYHPDGSDPNEQLFMKTKMISEVLLNPERKARYDSTTEDEVFMDPEFMEVLKNDPIFQQNLRDKGATMMDVFKNEFGEENLKYDKDDVFFHKEMGDTERIPWDYFSVDPHVEEFEELLELRKVDEQLSHDWYGCLLAVAPVFSYTKTIKVLLLWTGDPYYIQQANMVAIPRSWPPSKANAFALFSVLRIH